MIQSSQVINGIGKQRLIHSNPIQRNLRNICYDASLPEQFADISTGTVIPVYNEPTGLTDIGFVNLADFIQSPTSTTELRSMIGVNLVERNQIFFTQTSKRMEQFIIRNFIDNFISFSSFGIPNLSSNPQFIQILNNNKSITIRFTQINNLMSKFPTRIFNKIVFVTFQSFEGFESFLASQISKTFEFIFSSFNNLSFDKHFFSKIEMPQKFLILGVVNRNSNIISISIYTNNIFTFNGFFKIFFNKNLDSKILEDKNRTDIPTINKRFSQSLICSILNNGQMNSFAFCVSRNRNNKQTFIICFYGKQSFIKSNRDTLNFITNFSSQENLKERSLNKSRLKFILFSEIFINHRLQSISADSFIILPNRKDFLGTNKIFRIQFRKFGCFSNCRLSDIDSNSFLHRNKKYKNNLLIYSSIPQFIHNLTAVQDMDFLRMRLKNRRKK